MNLAINGGTPLRKKKLQYGKQTIDESDKQAIKNVLDENTYLTTGPLVVEFEKKVCEFVNAKYGIAVNSGTSALHLALDALNLSATDEVIVTCMSFVASSNAIVYCGAIPVFCDIDSNTMNIDVSKIESLVTKNTRAIVAVDFTGQPCDYHEIRKIANKYDLKIIEDAAHSIGCQLSQCSTKPMVGSFADITTFSFHPVKNITTCEGGMCVTNNESYYKKMKAFRAHGIHTDYRERQQKTSHYYEMTELGYNYRIPDLLCALGINQLKRLPQWIIKRNLIAKFYDEKLKSLNNFLIPLTQKYDNAYHIYIIKLKLENLTVSRDEIFTALHAEGLGVNVHYMPIHMHPFYKKNYKTYEGMMPVAEDCYKRILTLPIFPTMSDQDMQDTVDILSKVLNAHSNPFIYRKTNNIDVIIQARMGSTRLPGKVMKKLEDKIVLDHVIDRVSRAKNIRNVIICTSKMKRDDIIYDHCKKRNIKCFRGSEKNVLNRYYETAKFYGSETIVRLTSDCPLFDPVYLDKMVDKFFELNLNYLGPKYYGQHKFPDGFNCEVFNFNVLEEAELNANNNEKEHVSTYIIKKYSSYQYDYLIKNNYSRIDLEQLHLSLDTLEDYELIKNIFKNVYLNKNDFTLEDVLQYLNIN